MVRRCSYWKIHAPAPFPRVEEDRLISYERKCVKRKTTGKMWKNRKTKDKNETEVRSGQSVQKELLEEYFLAWRRRARHGFWTDKHTPGDGPSLKALPQILQYLSIFNTVRYTTMGVCNSQHNVTWPMCGTVTLQYYHMPAQAHFSIPYLGARGGLSANKFL